MFFNYLQSDPAFYLTWVVVITFSICCHEVAHAWMAAHEGDYTACRQGYLTLNPLKVMGPMSLIALAMFGVAWGAVPVNRAQFRRPASQFLVSFAGPASNLILAVLFALLAGLVGSRGLRSEDLKDAYKMLLYAGTMSNLFLFLFNMLPLPMLDGWDVFACFIPPMRRLPAESRGMVGLLLLVVVFNSPLGGWLWRAANIGAAVMVGTVRALTGG